MLQCMHVSKKAQQPQKLSANASLLLLFLLCVQLNRWSIRICCRLRKLHVSPLETNKHTKTHWTTKCKFALKIWTPTRTRVYTSHTTNNHIWNDDCQMFEAASMAKSKGQLCNAFGCWSNWISKIEETTKNRHKLFEEEIQKYILIQRQNQVAAERERARENVPLFDEYRCKQQ